MAVATLPHRFKGERIARLLPVLIHRAVSLNASGASLSEQEQRYIRTAIRGSDAEDIRMTPAADA